MANVGARAGTGTGLGGVGLPRRALDFVHAGHRLSISLACPACKGSGAELHPTTLDKPPEACKACHGRGSQDDDPLQGALRVLLDVVKEVAAQGPAGVALLERHGVEVKTW